MEQWIRENLKERWLRKQAVDQGARVGVIQVLSLSVERWMVKAADEGVIQGAMDKVEAIDQVIQASNRSDGW
jgi:hypothetical protein